VKSILVDVNVVLDVLLDRPPHSTTSGLLFAAIERGRIPASLAAHAVTTIYYLLHKELGTAKAKHLTAALLQVFGVAAVDRAVIDRALTLTSTDFEDAVTAAAAEHAQCDFIVTRDPKGFRASPVRALAPETFLPFLDPLTER
jgi:predicted nucleic acid-binding protein